MSICHIFFFIDALGAEVVRDQPVIRELAEHFHTLRSVFGYSSACVPSILTGRFPEEHLHWSYFTYRGPGTGLRVPAWMQLLPAPLRDRGRIRRYLSSLVAHRNGIQGYFQLYLMPLHELHHYSHCEPCDIFRPGGINRGESIIDLLVRTGTPHWISDWHAPAAANWAGLERAAALEELRFLFIYDGSLDGWLHQHTRHSPALPARLAEIQHRVERVLKVARAHHDQVLFYLFSDHGMSTIERHLDPFPELERSRLRMHRDYHCVVDSTMIRLWYPDHRVQARLRECLDEVPGLTLLSREYLAAEHCAFPDRRFGDDIYLAEPHLLLVPSHMGRKPMAGMHGYCCDDPDSYAVLLTNDGRAAPKCIVDLFPLMVRAVQVTGQAREG